MRQAVIPVIRLQDILILHHGKCLSTSKNSDVVWMEGVSLFTELAGAKRLFVGITSLAVTEIDLPL